MKLDNDELNTILAALRAYQQRGYGDSFSRPDWLQSIACPDGDSTSLDDGAIDKLCERLNCDAVSLTGVGKHTPGPWIVCINEIDQLISVEQDGSKLGEHDGEPVIVVMCVDDMGDGLDREIGLANARLIAAAPEMLVACEQALALLGTDSESERGCGSPDEVADDLRYAIAKAKGGCGND